MHSTRINQWLAVAVGHAGLISTASATNSTLFSEAILAKNLIADDILSSEMGKPDYDAVPARTVLVIGFFTAAFAVLGSLKAVVDFASLAFIVVFGTVSALALVNREETDIRTLPPLVGLVSAAAFFVMLLYFLFTRLPHVFFLVAVTAVVVFTVEAAYFQRDSISEGIREVETEV